MVGIAGLAVAVAVPLSMTAAVGALLVTGR
jgi:hypothetical protein